MDWEPHKRIARAAVTLGFGHKRRFCAAIRNIAEEIYPTISALVEQQQ